MNPAEVYARLKLMELALKRVLPEAAHAVEEYRAAVRAKTLETDHGSVSVVRPKPTITLDPDKFLAWVQENRPEEILPQVRPSFAKAYAEGLQEVDGQVIDPKTGEVVEFAYAIERRPYLTCRLTEESKRAAESQIIAAVEAWNPLEVEQ